VIDPTEMQYYRVLDGPVKKILDQFSEDNRMFVKVLSEFRDEVGAIDITVKNNKFCGVKFLNDAVPKHWKKLVDGGCSPNARTIPGRALAKRVQTFPRGVGTYQLSVRLNEEFRSEIDNDARVPVGYVLGFIDDYDRTNFYTTVEYIGATCVLKVPIRCVPFPGNALARANVEPLKTSEYWRLREQERSK